jgi:hypothetical protein
MLTIFTLPKAFEGHIGVIQTNAVQSWKRLHPDVQVILCGEEKGMREVAEGEGVEMIADVERNEFGTPLLSDAFAKAQGAARHKVMCYVNGDILFLGDFRRAVERIRMDRYLMVGQRSNMDLGELWDFGGEWETKLRERARRESVLFDIYGLDYFVFPRGADFAVLPPFAVGRPGWDMWFVGHARRNSVPLIDASSSVLAIHQNHGYGHVAKARGTKWEGPEGDRNRQLMGEYTMVYGTMDATHVMTQGGVKRALGLGYLNRRWKVAAGRRKWLKPLVALTDGVTPVVKWALGRNRPVELK